MIAPRGPLEAVLPGYSLIDVLRCGASEDGRRRLAEVFGGRVVLVGGALAEEDRKPAPDRFLPRTGTRAANEPGCALPPVPPSAPASGTVPGVFLHAAAVDAVLRGQAVREAPAAAAVVLDAAFAAGGAGAALALPPAGAAAALAVLVAALTAAAYGLLLGANLWLPFGGAILAGTAALGVGWAGRYLLEERRRRRIQRAFGHYLSPVVVRRLAEEESGPVLAGETRDITVMFADLSGFTALSGTLEPPALVAVTNRYLALIVEAVEATGGYVDKFIGDAVMAVWGAPAADPDHAAHAVAAALRAAEAVTAAARDDAGRGLPSFTVKIGLESGPATVGSVGAHGRFNYTAVGATVNLAARLQDVPPLYGCAVVLGPAAAAAAANQFLLCELDEVRLKGVARPLPIFRPLAPLAKTSPDDQAHAESYAAALALYRAGRMAEAAAAWDRLAEAEPTGPAAVMRDRARRLLREGAGETPGPFVIAKG